MARSLIKRSSITALLVLALALALAAVAPLGAAAVNCPASASNSHNGNNLDDVVHDWSKSCDQSHNYECRACDLWQAVRGVTKPYAYQGGGPGKQYRSKILPTKPVTGLESIVKGSSADEKATYFLWSKALIDVSNGAAEAKASKTAHPIAVINSLSARSRHQAHIHVGSAQSKDFFECVNREILKAPPAVGVWKDVSPGQIAQTACNNLKAGGFPLSIRATQASGNGINGAIRAGFGGSAAAILTDPKLWRTGVVVQPLAPNKPGQYLVFLVAGSNDYMIFGDKPETGSCGFFPQGARNPTTRPPPPAPPPAFFDFGQTE
jgi:CDP-diacylglycerol pyrophosphatase